jgi:hypothetical protein
VNHTSVWDDDIKTDIEEVGRQAVDLTRLPQDREQWRTPVIMAMKFMVLKNRGNLTS